PSDWLGNPTGAFIAIVVMDIWQWTPFVALIFLAGLSTVPVEIEEAARLETKSHWALLRYVQLPYLLPGLTAVLILRSADVLKLFDMVFVMTRGGPGSATDPASVLVPRVRLKGFHSRPPPPPGNPSPDPHDPAEPPLHPRLLPGDRVMPSRLLGRA